MVELIHQDFYVEKNICLIQQQLWLCGFPLKVQ